MSLISLLLPLLALPIAFVWLLPAISDLASLLVAFLRPHASLARPAGTRTRILFLVPAHNESLLIGKCVSSLIGMSRFKSNFDVVVIADNCDDDTADIAAASGARVLKRNDPANAGKPAAIQWALERLAGEPFDAVTIIDADTIVDSQFADALADFAPLRDKAIQTYNGIGNERDSWLTELGGLLVRVRYDGQFLLKRRAGLNCPMANGMTMGTNLLRRAGWASESLTENWELYARWTALGERIEFAPMAKLASQEAKSMEQSATQRRRWQAGRLLVLRQYAISILCSRRINLLQKSDALAELSAPGPVLHAAVGVLLTAAFIFIPGQLATLVTAMFAASLLPNAAWTIIVLRREPNRGELVLALARLPFYAVWRIGIALMAISTARRGSWLRSPRHISEPLRLS